jgi:hypothetical protein
MAYCTRTYKSGPGRKRKLFRGIRFPMIIEKGVVGGTGISTRSSFSVLS